METEKQPILFAIYKNNEFQGFRQDTFGTIGKEWGKIYTYSKEQVDTVLRNIESAFKEPSFGKFLGSTVIQEAEQKIKEKMDELSGFEVRVIKGPTPIYERNFDVEKAEYVVDKFPSYDAEECQKIFQNPDDQEVIETHYMALHSKLELS